MSRIAADINCHLNHFHYSFSRTGSTCTSHIILSIFVYTYSVRTRRRGGSLSAHRPGILGAKRHCHGWHSFPTITRTTADAHTENRGVAFAKSRLAQPRPAHTRNDAEAAPMQRQGSEEPKANISNAPRKCKWKRQKIHQIYYQRPQVSRNTTCARKSTHTLERVHDICHLFPM